MVGFFLIVSCKSDGIQNDSFRLKVHWGASASRHSSQLSLCDEKIVVHTEQVIYIEEGYKVESDDYELIVHPQKIKALIENFNNVRFYDLRSYYRTPFKAVRAVQNEKNEWFLTSPGFLMDGWYITIELWQAKRYKKVQLANSSLNEFHTILRSLHDIGNNKLKVEMEKCLKQMEDATIDYFATSPTQKTKVKPVDNQTPK